jgi:asparagine synthase (glutamine-hydrolysing)
VKTYSVGYREVEYSELDYARETARALNTDHHEVLVGPDEFFNTLPRLIWHEDEPITWPSSVSLYFVSKLASENVKVVLTGEGADEIFAGYSRYRFYQKNLEWLGAYRMIPSAVRNFIRAQVATTPLLSASLRRKLQHTFVGLGEDLESLYLDNFYSAFRGGANTALCSQTGSPYSSFQRYWDGAPGRSNLQHMLYADQKTYLVELLMKQDQMSMACSIESRVPLLDHTFVEFASSVPDHLKVRGNTGKYILKRAVEDVIPREVIERKKLGFPTPLRQWLAGGRSAPLLEMLESGQGLIGEYLNQPAIKTLLDRHRSGQVDATDRIWRLLNLQVWGDAVLLKRHDIDRPLLPASTDAVAAL